MQALDLASSAGNCGAGSSCSALERATCQKRGTANTFDLLIPSARGSEEAAQLCWSRPGCSCCTAGSPPPCPPEGLAMNYGFGEELSRTAPSGPEKGIFQNGMFWKSASPSAQQALAGLGREGFEASSPERGLWGGGGTRVREGGLGSPRGGRTLGKGRGRGLECAATQNENGKHCLGRRGKGRGEARAHTDPWIFRFPMKRIVLIVVPYSRHECQGLCC